MSVTHESKLAAIDANLRHFLTLLPTLVMEHQGSYALLRHGDIVGFYAEALDAQIEGNQRFEDGLFSIQQVTDSTEGLGYFTCAVHQRST